MASANRMFLDSAALRNVPYPGSFSAELMFRSHTNPFPHVQFIPDRVTEFSVSPEGMRFYRVAWQETWLPEHHLLHYQNLIETFWRNQNELNTVCENNNQQPSKSAHSSISDGNTSKNTNQNQQQCFLNVLQSDHVDLQTPPTLPPVPDVPVLRDLKAIEKQTLSDFNALKQQMLGTNVSTNNPLLDKNIIVTDSNGTPLQLPNTKILPVPEQSHQNGLETIQHSDVLQSTQSNNSVISSNQQQQHHHQQQQQQQQQPQPQPQPQQLKQQQDDIDTPTNIRKKTNNEQILSISLNKKGKTTSLKLSEFEIVNIENPNATEIELKNHAEEVLCAFGKKRVRCPNGSSSLPHTCFFCLRILSSRKKLREHHFSIHLKNVGEFVCGICQQRFAYRRKLKAHMIAHSDTRNFVCKICGLTCKRRTHLHTHMQTHEKERNYRCDVCHQNFKVQADLKNHCLNEHKNQVSKCNVCKHTLQTAYSVYIHSMRHSGTREHTCQICKASFKSKHHLTTHQKTHEEVTEKIKCPACDKEFSDKKYFRKHLEINHEEIAKTFRYEYLCTICDKDFAYKGRLDEHMKMHEEETEEDKEARIKSTRRKKAEALSDDVIEKLSDKCERIIVPETGETKLKCKLCDREYRLISNIERHLEDHRTGKKAIKQPKKTYDCEICDKTFYHEARLAKHMTIHLEPPPKPKPKPKSNQFSCRNCQGKFKSKSCLLTHMKKCSLINKGAGKRKASLKAKEKLDKEAEYASSDDETMAEILVKLEENKTQTATKNSKDHGKKSSKKKVKVEESSDDDYDDFSANDDEDVDEDEDLSS